MGWVNFNANPAGKQVGDCAVRAISKALNQDWNSTFIDLCLQAYVLCDMPSSNNVWAAYLRQKGFKKRFLPENCPDDYTVKDFCRDHPKGVFLVALDKHVVAIVSGQLYDTWNSENECPIYYFERDGKK